MLPMVVFVAVVCGVVLHRMTPEERTRLFHRVARLARLTTTAASDTVRRTPEGCDEFYEELRSRTRYALITPAIVVISGLVHLLMASSGGDAGDRALVGWGASLGPLTTNGEWWRLATSLFLHRGWLHLIADAAGLYMAGSLVERVTGRTAFAVVYVAAGLLTGLWNLAAHPVSVSAGPAGAVFGVYGLLAATMMWGFAQRSPLTIPFAAVRQLWPGAAIFCIYHVATAGFGSATMWGGLLAGLVTGLILAARVSTATPPPRRVFATMAATVALVMTFAAPLRGIADVVPEVKRVIAMEERTSALYDVETVKFRSGTMTARQLAAVTEAIGAEVHDSLTALDAIVNVPPEHRPLWHNAMEYLRLREESWRLRVKALREGSMSTLQQASVTEFAALKAFGKVEQLTP